MVRKPQIDEVLVKEIDAILEESGQAYRNGEIALSLDIAMQAWDKIPDPKPKWDYYPQSMSVSFVEDFVSLGKVDEAKKWIKIVYETYGDLDHKEHYPLMIEGKALYDLGIKNEAYKIFGKIYEIYGREGFKGEHLNYLEFYLKERSNSHG